jgi:ABC-type multidrug transport system permease subunit
VNNQILLWSTIAIYLGFLVAGIFDLLDLFVVKLVIWTYLIGLGLSILAKLLNDGKQEKPL